MIFWKKKEIVLPPFTGMLSDNWTLFPPLPNYQEESVPKKESALNFQVILKSVVIDISHEKIIGTLSIGRNTLPDLKDGDHFLFLYNKNDLGELRLQKTSSSFSAYEASRYLVCDVNAGDLIFYLPYDIYFPYLCEICGITLDEFTVGSFIFLAPPKFHYEIITNYQIHLFLNGISAGRKYQFDCFKDHGVLRNY